MICLSLVRAVRHSRGFQGLPWGASIEFESELVSILDCPEEMAFVDCPCVFVVLFQGCSIGVLSNIFKVRGES